MSGGASWITHRVGGIVSLWPPGLSSRSINERFAGTETLRNPAGTRPVAEDRITLDGPSGNVVLNTGIGPHREVSCKANPFGLLDDIEAIGQLDATHKKHHA